MCTLLQCIYYDPAGSNIGLGWWRLVLHYWLVMLSKSSLRMIFETLIDIYIKLYSCFRKFRFDYEQISL